MSGPLRFPKQSDRDIVAALGRVRDAMKSERVLRVRVYPPHTPGEVFIDDEKPELAAKLDYVLSLHSRTIGMFQLIEGNGFPAVTVQRQLNKVWDEATFPEEWINSLQPEFRQNKLAAYYVRLVSACQKELHADDLDAALSGDENTAWNEYRKAQTEVLNSLSQTHQHVLVESAKQIERIREAEHAKNEDLRQQLRAATDAEEIKLTEQHAANEKRIAEREDELAKKLAAYETHEALYVARQKAGEQLEQLKGWLKDSSLTKGTVSKRGAVRFAYGFGILTTGYITYLFSSQGFELLKNAGSAIAQVPWWQWGALTLKSVVPFAAFTTLLIYFIRWESAWAAQHANEELRTRARVIDIGRSAWLLEAARDGKAPPELIRELARNLFVDTINESGADLHPNSVGDLLLQQLASVRVKSADGTEVEAKRK